MVNFRPLAAEIVSLVWGTPGNFNGFRVLSTLLQRRRSTEVNQTLHYVWPSPGLVRYIYTFGISCPLTEFCHVQNSLCVHLCPIAQVSRAISSQLRQYRQSTKSFLNSNMSPTCLHNMANVCPLTAQIGLGVWGTPGNFNGFRVWTAFLQRPASSLGSCQKVTRM